MTMGDAPPSPPGVRNDHDDLPPPSSFTQEEIRGEFFPFRARTKLRVLCTYVCVPASDPFRFLLSETFATALGLTIRVASRKIRYLTNFLIPNLLGFLLNRRPGPMALKRNNIYSFSQSFLLLACVLLLCSNSLQVTVFLSTLQ